MKLLVSSCLLLLPVALISVVSSSPNPRVGRSQGNQRQVSGRWLREGGQECECRDWFLRAPKRKSTPVLEPARKPCPCDHVKGSEKKNRHQKHHRKPNRPSRTCQQFLKRCQLASFALPL
ncbi:C-X-C motif chemokine 17 isoform X2 [Phodopus roborovskii]|uniref:Cxcl17 protein n=1 Tax=Phodopus roborovskii TaxID=109678 RepID=A0AAV0AAL7_PHORO|nr:C-X-C motif chemokine 17 isoform X2 [Phodopus roborovskii]CAH7380941.1 Cxcl17 [Phodopus roborovskii]